MAKYTWSKARRAKFTATIAREKNGSALAVEVVHPKGGVAEDVVEDLLDILWKCLTIEMKISLFKNMPTGV